MSQMLQSVQSKLLLGLAAVFVVLMIVTSWHMASSERALVDELATAKALDKASSYFDGVNTMMLTGTTAQRDVLRRKILADADITELRLIRTSAVNDVYGKGNPEQVPMDELDRRALAGETIIQPAQDDNGRVVTVITPHRASKDFRGTNCLNCHQVPEGTVLGATRVTLSLAELDGQIQNNLLTGVGIKAAILIAGLLGVAWLMRSVLLRPLHAMRDALHRIETNADLTERLPAGRDDEMGRLSKAFNGMLEHFGKSLSQVTATSHGIKQATDRMAEIASQTSQAAEQQRAETDKVAAAINELESTALGVRQSATSAADVSVEADETASRGASTTREAIDGIRDLANAIEEAATVVNRLDEGSRNVSAVLDVIRGIAEQTNLLALNAAIEAARAGESGRGFAVVADEVRNLATRSQESTEDIERIIEQLQGEARNAVEVMTAARESAHRRGEQVTEADASLNQIADKVGQIRTFNMEVMHAAEEQSSVTQEVNRNIVTINDLAMRTADDAESAATETGNLVKLSGELTEMVGRFRF